MSGGCRWHANPALQLTERGRLARPESDGTRERTACDTASQARPVYLCIEKRESRTDNRSSRGLEEHPSTGASHGGEDAPRLGEASVQDTTGQDVDVDEMT
jgi:hypothetical protein